MNTEPAPESRPPTAEHTEHAESAAPVTDERTRFLRKLAHDLRSPLNAIVLSANALLRRDALDESARRALDVILRNSEKIGTRVQEALDGAAPAPAHLEPVRAGADDGSAADTERVVHVLLVEDDLDDARTLQRELVRSGASEFEISHAASLAEAREACADGGFDLLLLDLFLPDSQGLETVSAVQQFAGGAATVVLTGVADREVAIAAVREGAQDYLIKGATDGPSVVRAMYYALERKSALVEREHLIEELQDALATVKKLSGLLPICASCKRIRDDGGAWNQLEEYIHQHSEAEFSHGICPECARKLFPEAFD